MNSLRPLRLASLLVASLAAAHAQQSADAGKDPAAILELGAAASRSLTDHSWTYGPDLAVEFTPVENWLEIEAGVTPLFRLHHSGEWNTDVLFKKPWTLSHKFEFMAGIGPEWVHTHDPGARRNSLAAEAALDLMYWPGPRRKFGWFVEPSFDYNFSRPHDRSISISAGLLISIP